MRKSSGFLVSLSVIYLILPAFFLDLKEQLVDADLGGAGQFWRAVS